MDKLHGTSEKYTHNSSKWMNEWGIYTHSKERKP